METDKLIGHHDTISERACVSAWHKHAWKYIVATIGIIFIIYVQWKLMNYGANNSANNTLSSASTSNKDRGNSLQKEFIFVGANNTQTENYTLFPGFDQNANQALTAIYIYNARLDAPTFSKSLQKFLELEFIYLDNVTVAGDFTRAYLPNLKSFTLNQFIGKDDHMEEYQESAKLHSNIFFDKVEGKTWEVNDIANLGAGIFVSVNGFKLIQISRDQGSISLYVPDCNNILQNINGTYTSLSLSSCTITKSSIPNNLNYLNLFDVTVSDVNISEIFKQLTQITDLYYDLPGETVDLSSLPSTLTFLSLSSATLTLSKTSSLNNLQQLALGFCNISTEVYEHFNTVSPSLQRISAFGFQSANYNLLDSLLGSKNVVWILMEEFDRTVTYVNKSIIDTKLAQIGIPSESSNFLIKKPKYSETLVGVVLTNTQDQEREYRYSLLGWGQFLTFSAYKTAEKYTIKT